VAVIFDTLPAVDLPLILTAAGRFACSVGVTAAVGEGAGEGVGAVLAFGFFFDLGCVCGAGADMIGAAIGVAFASACLRKSSL
jgi:hypothetical protein